MIHAVFWDFGGVLTTGPFEAFNRFERERGLPHNFLRKVNATNPHDNAWARFERSLISAEEFDREFERESRALGHPVPGARVIELIHGQLRPEMVEALRRCRGHFRNACLTNNVKTEEPETGPSAERAAAVREVMALFEMVIESSKLGVRKPEPRFYELACELMRIEPQHVVYLDDLGVNLKPAREMGMHTIKVTDPAQAIRELEAELGITLR